jgi:hypothetical protein
MGGRDDRGDKKAVMAVAHSLLRTTDHVLPGRLSLDAADSDARRHSVRTARRAVVQLERLGYRVVALEPAA